MQEMYQLQQVNEQLMMRVDFLERRDREVATESPSKGQRGRK
tara:strand:+ start:2020 stop:2145 length:126 start_codon:yes stop_codon:yes gene_type:complete